MEFRWAILQFCLGDLKILYFIKSLNYNCKDELYKVKDRFIMIQKLPMISLKEDLLNILWLSSNIFI